MRFGSTCSRGTGHPNRESNPCCWLPNACLSTLTLNLPFTREWVVCIGKLLGMPLPKVWLNSGIHEGQCVRQPPPPSRWPLGAWEELRAPWTRSTLASAIRRGAKKKRWGNAAVALLGSSFFPPQPNRTPNSVSKLFNYGWSGSACVSTGAWICFSK